MHDSRPALRGFNGIMRHTRPLCASRSWTSEWEEFYIPMAPRSQYKKSGSDWNNTTLSRSPFRDPCVPSRGFCSVTRCPQDILEGSEIQLRMPPQAVEGSQVILRKGPGVTQRGHHMQHSGAESFLGDLHAPPTHLQVCGHLHMKNGRV